MTAKDKDLQYIKDFSKITITQICKDLKVNRGNLLNGLASAENTKLVKEEITKRIKDIEKRLDQ